MIEWCDHHKNDPPSASDDDDSRRKTTDIDEWDQKFMQVDQEMLFEVILVSNSSAESLGASGVANKRTYRPPTTSISRLSLMSAARPLPT